MIWASSGWVQQELVFEGARLFESLNVEEIDLLHWERFYILSKRLGHNALDEFMFPFARETIRVAAMQAD